MPTNTATPAEKDQERRSGLLGPIGLSAVAVVLLAVGVAIVESYRDLQVVSASEAALRADIQQTQAEIERLEEYRQRLESDSVLLERLAREELGLVKPDDVVIVLPEALREP